MNLKQKSFYVVLVFALLLFVRSSNSQEAVIQAGCEDDYLPFCYIREDGEADGFSVELLRAALEAMGRDVSFKTGPWATLKEDLAQGRLDALPMVARTPEREKMYDFTFPYYTMHGTIVVREGNTDIHGPEDLKDKEVAVLREDSAHEYLERENLGAKIVPLPSFAIVLRELSEGKYDAVVIQKLLAFQIMKQFRIENLRTVGPPLTGYQQMFCFAVQEGDDELLSVLNEGLSIVMADGTFRNLNAKWFRPLEELSWTKSRIVVGGDVNYPPYEFLDANGQPAGYNVDLTRAIAEEIGLSVDIKLAPWAQVRDELAKGELDIIQGMFFSLERDKRFDFSPAHTVVQHVIVTRTDSPELSDMASLSGKTILVMKGDIMHDLAIRQGLESQITTAKSQEEALERLSAGEGDCALVAHVPAAYWIQKNNWRNLHVSSNPVLKAEYCYAVPSGKGVLLSDFTEGLAAVKKTGKYRQIQSKWLAPYEESKVNTRTVLLYVLAAVAPLLLLLVLSLFWTKTLKSQVRWRTTELRNSEARYRELVDNANSAIVRYDREGKIVFFNEFAQSFFGYSEEEIVGRHVSILLPEFESTGADLRNLAEDVINHPDDYVQNINENLCSDGRRVWMAWTNKPLLDEEGNVDGMLSIGTDITDRQKAEEELKRLNETLEQRVEERTDQVREQADELRALASELSQAEQRERRRLARVLHDHLQQILVAARMQLELVRRFPDKSSAESTIQGIDSMLNDAIDASRSLTVELSPPVLQEAGLAAGLTWVAGRMEEKNLFKVNVHADNTAEPASEDIRFFLFESVRELLLNSMKHSGVRKADVTMSRTPDNMVRIVVEDKGRGFDPEKLRLRGAGERGFGLFSIQQRLAYSGGRMEVESAPDQGVRVVLECPLGRTAEEMEASVTAPRPTDSEMVVRTKKKLLSIVLVDDHRIVREGLAGLIDLEPDMTVVGQAENGFQAVELAKSLCPDVVLMDVNMPGMNGIDATRLVKEHCPEVTVIGLSMHIDRDIADAMREAGAVAYFTKGGPFEDLIASIRSVCREKAERS